MTYNNRSPEYYKSVLELQEKLRKSEDERLMLEMKYNEMIQKSKNDEEIIYNNLRHRYKNLDKEQGQRPQRNEQILQTLDRIETKIAALSAKTERFKLLRSQYQGFLQGFYNKKSNDDYINKEPEFHKVDNLYGSKQHISPYPDKKPYISNDLRNVQDPTLIFNQELYDPYKHLYPVEKPFERSNFMYNTRVPYDIDLYSSNMSLNQERLTPRTTISPIYNIKSDFPNISDRRFYYTQPYTAITPDLYPKDIYSSLKPNYNENIKNWDNFYQARGNLRPLYSFAEELKESLDKRNHTAPIEYAGYQEDLKKLKDTQNELKMRVIALEAAKEASKNEYLKDNLILSNNSSNYKYDDDNSSDGSEYYTHVKPDTKRFENVELPSSRSTVPPFVFENGAREAILKIQSERRKIFGRYHPILSKMNEYRNQNIKAQKILEQTKNLDNHDDVGFEIRPLESTSYNEVYKNPSYSEKYTRPTVTFSTEPDTRFEDYNWRNNRESYSVLPNASESAPIKDEIEKMNDIIPQIQPKVEEENKLYEKLNTKIEELTIPDEKINLKNENNFKEEIELSPNISVDNKPDIEEPTNLENPLKEEEVTISEIDNLDIKNDNEIKNNNTESIKFDENKDTIMHITKEENKTEEKSFDRPDTKTTEIPREKLDDDTEKSIHLEENLKPREFFRESNGTNNEQSYNHHDIQRETEKEVKEAEKRGSPIKVTENQHENSQNLPIKEIEREETIKPPTEDKNDTMAHQQLHDHMQDAQYGGEYQQVYDENQPAYDYGQIDQPLAEGYDQTYYNQNQEGYDQNAYQMSEQYDPATYDAGQYQQYQQQGEENQIYDQNQQYQQQGEENQIYDQNQQYQQQGEENQIYDENQQYQQQGGENQIYDQNQQYQQEYADDGTAFQQYDENGQPLAYQYDPGNQAYGEYQEQQGAEHYQQENYDNNYGDQYNAYNATAEQNYDPNNFEYNQQLPEENVNEEQDKIIDSTIKKQDLLEILETDTESSKQELPISQDSDFDLSNK